MMGVQPGRLINQLKVTTEANTYDAMNAIQ